MLRGCSRYFGGTIDGDGDLVFGGEGDELFAESRRLRGMHGLVKFLDRTRLAMELCTG